ncbi:MAG: DegT/DnrJ/EryC1/StrS family aminotransferase [Planctomyces sp.]|nr:DegT/DnrJ/EryC1/StrS family aminotransferase [Planctomyces sp.]
MKRLYPRGTLDISWRHLFEALSDCLFGSHQDKTAGAADLREIPIGNAHSSVQGLITISVRSAFDLYLTELNLPQGSEVVMSAVSISDMFRIPEAHGLKVIPVPLSFETLSLSAQDVERSITEQTRLIVVAPLFGSRSCLTEICCIARRHGIIVIEDCAQAWRGALTLTGALDVDDAQDAKADVQMFSFGPIKTATALGGAFVLDKDHQRLLRISSIQTGYPEVAILRTLRRILRFIALKALSSPLAFGVFVWLTSLFGADYDELLFRATRGFQGSDLLEKLRHRPNRVQRNLVLRRLEEPHTDAIEARCNYAAEVLNMLPNGVVPGSEIQIGLGPHDHVHWVLPCESREPGSLIQRLRSAGFDATQRGSSLVHFPMVVPEPVCSENQSRWLTPERLANLVYLPMFPEMGQEQRTRMIDIIRSHFGEQSDVDDNVSLQKNNPC